MTPRRRLLIITPSFHDYATAIANAFNFLGFATAVCRYDDFASIPQKIWNKARFEFPELLGLDTTQARSALASARVIATIRQLQPDLALVIKGDVLSDDVWETLQSSRTPTVLWLYDELRRTRWEAQRLHFPGMVASYSPLDVAALSEQGLPAVHVPLGYDHLSSWTTRNEYAREVTFIGARYPMREALLVALSEAGVPVRAFGRDWSPAMKDRLRTWNAHRPDVPAGPDVARDQAYGVMQGSLATLNIHGDQDGFTMRTFEAAGVGAVQLVDRQDVAQHYEVDSEVVTFSGEDELIERVQMVNRDQRKMAALREAARTRTLAEHTLVHRAELLQQGW